MPSPEVPPDPALDAAPSPSTPVLLQVSRSRWLPRPLARAMRPTVHRSGPARTQPASDPHGERSWPLGVQRLRPGGSRGRHRGPRRGRQFRATHKRTHGSAPPTVPDDRQPHARALGACPPRSTASGSRRTRRLPFAVEPADRMQQQPECRDRRCPGQAVQRVTDTRRSRRLESAASLPSPHCGSLQRRRDSLDRHPVDISDSCSELWITGDPPWKQRTPHGMHAMRSAGTP